MGLASGIVPPKEVEDIVQETYDSSLRAGRYVLENVGLSEFEAAKAEKIFYDNDRLGILELAKVWKPDVPNTKNAEYRRVTEEMDRALAERLNEIFEERDQN